MRTWINADDFGFTKTCTDAIFKCLEEKTITSTTACSNGAFFDYAISLVKNTDYVKRIGIHVNLTEGKPLTQSITENKNFCYENGMFNGFRNRYRRLSRKDKNDLYLEIKAQFQMFIDAGINIDHIDSHHHIHNSFRVLPIILKVASEYKISKIRLLRNAGKMNLLKRIYKALLNLKLKRMAYSDFMGDLADYDEVKKAENKIFELMIHPDFDKNGFLINRENEDYDNPLGQELIFDKFDIIQIL